MPETRIALDPDQADDLRELITLTAILQEWLEGAADHILDDLAHFAYRDTSRPRSYAAWLTDDLAPSAAGSARPSQATCDHRGWPLTWAGQADTDSQIQTAHGGGDREGGAGVEVIPSG